ncbi:MAG: O-methyltransferase [Parasporobacterium sp.]|nr:O-methyltransferase [Parasporobacterium sp.]
MIVNENITAYINSLEPDGPVWLENLRTHAEDSGVPIIRREMEPFIRVLMTLHHLENILEIGTAIGYSSLFMAECDNDVHITTIENYEPRLQEARTNLKDRDNIRLLEGDAAVLIKELKGPYDMIFLDAAKGQYITMLPDLLRLMKKGSILLADNVLQDGELIRSRYITPRRQRTIHSRMREFIWEVKHNESLCTSLISIGDGVVLCVKTKD